MTSVISQWSLIYFSKGIPCVRNGVRELRERKSLAVAVVDRYHWLGEDALARAIHLTNKYVLLTAKLTFSCYVISTSFWNINILLYWLVTHHYLETSQCPPLPQIYQSPPQHLLNSLRPVLTRFTPGPQGHAGLCFSTRACIVQIGQCHWHRCKYLDNDPWL